MGIVVTRRPKMPRFNGHGVAAVIKALVPGGIIERTGRGIDMHGRQFASYSRRYLRLLRDMGEDRKVDLRLSGGLMNSIKARGVEITGDRVVVTVAPDTGTSPVWKPKQVGSRARSQRVKGKQSPPHNILAHYLHYGTAKMKARRFLGLTSEQTRSLFSAIAKVMWR